jgi:hypothetical protein
VRGLQSSFDLTTAVGEHPGYSTWLAMSQASVQTDFVEHTIALAVFDS